MPGTGVLFRVTRSGAFFSPFAQLIQACDPFDFSSLLRETLACEDPEHDDTEGYDFEPIAEVDPEPKDGHTTSSPFGSPLAPITDSPGSSRPTSPLLLSPVPSTPKRRGNKSQIKMRKDRSKKARKLKREIDMAAASYGTSRVRLKAKAHHVLRATEFRTVLKTPKLRVAKTGWVGLRDHNEREDREYSLDELVGEGSKFGFSLKAWDGVDAKPLGDESGRVISVLVGRPKDETEKTWGAVHDESLRVIEQARIMCSFSRKQASHRRGDFAALAQGPSFGGGQKVPGNLRNSVTNAAVLEILLCNWAIQRFAALANGAFAMWAPKLYNYYRSQLGLLFKAHTSLRRNFINSVWATITFNFGPRTVCYVHRDPGNLAFGWCAIMALGRFDPKRSGHLILWDMKLVIEFPPGSTILIPSATLRHSNVRLQEGETRVSFTQYTSGGLFWWVENGFRTIADFAKQDKEGKQRADEVSETRWEEGLKLFSTLDELKN